MKFRDKTQIFPKRGEIYQVSYLDLTLTNNPHFSYVGKVEVWGKCNEEYGHGPNHFEVKILELYEGGLNCPKKIGSTNCIPLQCFIRRIR